MYAIKEYMDKIIENGSKEDMEKLEEKFYDLMSYAKTHEVSLYDKIECELYKIAYGEVITPELADKWVSNMRPLAKWTKSETDDVLKTKGLDVNDVDFYVVMNMMYSDYKNVLGEDDVNKYVEMALDFLHDEDAGENKLFNYYFKVVK